MATSRILGPDGQPIQLGELTKELAAPSHVGIRTTWHASAADNLTPSRLASILSMAARTYARDYLTLAEEMEERDLHYASVLGTRKLAITGLKVRVESASDNTEDVRRADAIRAVVATPEFGEMVANQVDALGKGYAVDEIMWDRSGAQWTPKFKPRDQRFFTYDPETGTELRLLDEASPLRGVPLAPYKFIVHTPKIRAGLPIRGGLARLAAVAYMCKAWTWRDWMAFADIYGLPMRIGTYGPGASKDDIAKLMAAVANLGSDAAAVMPESVKIAFEEAAQVNGAGDFFEKLATFWDKQISKAVLGQTMTADDGASMSQAKVHNDVRLDILEADAGALSNTLQRQLVRPYCDLNFTPSAYPRLFLVVPQPEDTKALVEALSTLVPMGLRVEASVIRDRLGLPDPPKDAEVLVAPAAAQAAPPNADPKPALNRGLNAEDIVPVVADNADAVALGVDLVDLQAAPTLHAWVEELRDAIDDAGSLDRAQQLLLDRYPALPLAPLARIYAQAFATLELAGRAEAQHWIDVGNEVATAANAEQAGAGIINRGWQPAGEFFMQKISLPTTRWDDLWQGQHARAFVVAGATRDALLLDLRRAVEDAVVFGGSYDSFKRDFEEIVTRQGWTGWTGEGSARGRDWRARTIYQTNLSTAHAAGRYQQMTQPDVLEHMPHWQYRHNTVNNPREQHQAWDGMVLRWDDAWWDTHFPPNGWGCRCDVRPLSERQLQRLGKGGPDKAPPPGVGDPPPEWSYNVGQATWGKPVAANILESQRGGAMVSLDPRGPADFGRPAKIALDAPTAQPIERIRDAGALREAFRVAIGGDSAIWKDPAGARINVTDAVVEHWLQDTKRLQGREQYLPLLRETIEQPYEIWVGWARNELTGKVELRRRYVKAVDVGNKRVLGFVAEAVGGQWVGFNFLSGGLTGANNLRQGMLLWGRG
jgi:SPP1 gp7 family putative phage head morphogenesis protein